MKKKIKVAITGAAGQISYSLLFRIASGEVFGSDTEVALSLVELEHGIPRLKGVVMELEDCAFPLLKNIYITSDLNEGFSEVNWAILVGSVPRKEGMERKDLLEINGKIFVGQGKAIQESAADDVRILVVGNPCNTNCLIARAHAPDIPDDRWFAMTALDENRAKTQLAIKSGSQVTDVTNMCIWGNHSATQYPNFYDAKIKGVPAVDVIQDETWLQNDFIKVVQQRGSQVISARGASSAASAANAILDTIKRIISPTSEGDFFSTSIVSDGSYDVPKGLIFSFPLRSDGENWSIVQGLELNDFSRGKIQETVSELEEEREAVKGLL
ncbi:malate dehydrogenase [Candidatus Peregrinibacteria bacterium]|nr:malate dehydrogenase [Candidatus Peregrinibacteria bacterium]